MPLKTAAADFVSTKREINFKYSQLKKKRFFREKNMSDYSSDEMEEEDDELTIKQERVESLFFRKVATKLLVLFREQKYCALNKINKFVATLLKQYSRCGLFRFYIRVLEKPSIFNRKLQIKKIYV